MKVMTEKAFLAIVLHQIVYFINGEDEIYTPVETITPYDRGEVILQYMKLTIEDIKIKTTFSTNENNFNNQCSVELRGFCCKMHVLRIYNHIN